MRWVLAAVVMVVAGVLGLDLAFPLDLGRAGMVSPELDDASGRVLSLLPARDGAVRLAMTEMEAGPDLVRLLMAREDRRFGVMPGVDPLALVRAAGQMVRHGRVVSGGSTLAMQVARLLEPHPRTVLGKLHDMARAVQLEAHLGRAGVLRLYLTLAPMGGRVEGLRAASLLYFGCEPARLSTSQSALLVGLAQSPARRRPDRHPEAAWRGAARVLAAAGEAAGLVRTGVRAGGLPALARHLAARGGERGTTLDGDLQAAVEALAGREVAGLEEQADLAVLVVRNRDRAVLAYLGGVRFLGPGGMVDAVRARRSPGSALKPFIYAMAFDRGLAGPETLLEDGALRLGTYAPRDFDRRERGLVTAGDALRQSLNRPAVRLLAGVGPGYFAAGLRRAGAVLRFRGEASAALALGGVGMSLWDLAGLYADLADRGVVRGVHVRGEGTGGGRLVGAGAARMVVGVLQGQAAPGGMGAVAGHAIGFKTGTSYGYRDAWAAGVTGDYTVVVWVGRRDGTPRPGVTGLQAAAPVLFRVFSLLPAEVGEVAATGGAPGLRRAVAGRGLRIMFPPGGVELAYAPGGRIDLRAAGGVPPYRWLVDGAPLGAGWVPEGPGFSHVTVMDGVGGVAWVDVRLVGG